MRKIYPVVLLCLGIQALSLSKALAMASCPSLQGFYAYDLRKKLHFEFYDVTEAGKLNYYVYRSFLPDGSAEKRDFVPDGKTRPIDGRSNQSASCKNGELVLNLHSWTPKLDDFPRVDFYETRRFNRLLNGDLTVFITTISLTSDGHYSEERERVSFPFFTEENFPDDSREFTKIPNPKISGKATGTPGSPAVLLSRLYVEGHFFSPSLEGKDLSMFAYQPNQRLVELSFNRLPAFPFAYVTREIPEPPADRAITLEWHRDIQDPLLTTWPVRHERCWRSSPRKVCTRSVLNGTWGELSFGGNGERLTLTQALDWKTDESLDNGCCEDL